MMKGVRLIALVILFIQSLPAKPVSKEENKLEEEGSVYIIAYLGVQDRGVNGSDSCSDRIYLPGLMFFEALRYTINEINQKSNELQNCSVGYVAVNTCKSWLLLRKNVKTAVARHNNIGVLGPSTSDEAIFTAPILSVFNIPMISHLATSIDLEDREKYENFYRTVPSDRYYVDAFVDVLIALKWNFVSVVASEGNYGQRGHDYFISVSKAFNICISKRVMIHKGATESYYRTVIQLLLLDKRALGVVLFTTSEDTSGLLHAANAMGVSPGRLFWLANTHFRSAITADVAHLTDGAIMLELDVGYNKAFENYYLSLNPLVADYPWFHAFWESSFSCNLKPRENGLANCTGKEKLQYGVHFDPSIPIKAMIDAVLVYTCGFKMMIKEHCPAGDARVCVRNWIFNDSLLLPTAYMLKNLYSSRIICNSSFTTPHFLKDGGTSAKFKVLNIKFNRNTFYFTPIGIWQGGLNQTEALLMIGNHTTGANLTRKILSSCNSPCKVNEIKIPETHHRSCCWDCKPCFEHQIVFNNTCKVCPNFEKPSSRGGCTPLPIVHVKTSDLISIITLVFCFIGIKLTTVVLGVYLKNWDSRIVKAAGKELSSVMIIGLYLCFITPIFYLSKPDDFICSVQRFSLGVSLTTCYTPLLLKTNRIYRIFQGGKNAKLRPSFISPKSQVFICLALISIQVLFGITCVVASPPKLTHVISQSRDSVTVMCSESIESVLLNLVICCMMMLMCTYFAFKTRKFPKNYNESRSIVVTMYFTCFIWGVFIPMFFFANNVSLLRVYMLCVFCIVLAYITLVGLFGSRLRLLLVSRVPTEEDRSTSTGYGMNANAGMNITQIKFDIDYKDHSESVAKKEELEPESENIDKSIDTEVDDTSSEKNACQE